MSMIDRQTALEASVGDVLHDMHDGFGSLQHDDSVTVTDPVSFPAEGGCEFIRTALRKWGIDNPHYLNKTAVVVNVDWRGGNRVSTLAYSYDDIRFGMFTISTPDR